MLTARRNQWTRPPICSADQKIWLQNGLFEEIPDDIYAVVRWDNPAAAPAPPLFVDSCVLHRAHPALHWGQNPSTLLCLRNLTLDAVLINQSLTLNVDLASTPPPDSGLFHHRSAQNLAAQPGVPDLISTQFQLPGPQYTLAHVTLIWRS